MTGSDLHISVNRNINKDPPPDDGSHLVINTKYFDVASCVHLSLSVIITLVFTNFNIHAIVEKGVRGVIRSVHFKKELAGDSPCRW